MCMELMFFDFCYKSRMKMRASEAHWRLPSSPIVRKKHVLSLCKLAKCPNPLFYRCKFLPRLNRDCFFDFCYKSRMKMRASDPYWRLPSSPIVRKKHVLSLCKLGKCPNPLFYRCKFLAPYKTRHYFLKPLFLRQNKSASEPYSRLPSPPIVRKKHAIFLCKLALHQKQYIIENILHFGEE